MLRTSEYRLTLSADYTSFMIMFKMWRLVAYKHTIISIYEQSLYRDVTTLLLHLCAIPKIWPPHPYCSPCYINGTLIPWRWLLALDINRILQNCLNIKEITGETGQLLYHCQLYSILKFSILKHHCFLLLLRYMFLFNLFSSFSVCANIV